MQAAQVYRSKSEDTMPILREVGLKSGALLTARNILRLAQLFPDCVQISAQQELTVDVPRLFAHLGVNAHAEPIALGLKSERFELSWPGKAAARRSAMVPLDPVRLSLDEERSIEVAQTKNLFFEGDNLTVLKLMQSCYQGAIKLVYLDPPYNSGSGELVYHDKFRTRKERLGPDDSGHVHGPWCSMIYQRLLLVRPLLAANGAIFASIDDREYANLRQIMDEVMGAANFVSTLVWKKKQGGSNDSGYVVTDHEYILVYAKDITQVDLGLDLGAMPEVRDYNYCDEHGRYNLITLDKSSIRFSPALVYDIVGPDGTVYRPRLIKSKQSCWRWSAEHVAKDYEQLVFKDGKVYTKNYLKQGEKPRSLLIDSERFGRTSFGKADLQELFASCPFSYPKPVRLISYLIGLMQGTDFTVLDLFAGSGTTAQAVMECNAKDGGTRKFIMVQRPEPLTAQGMSADLNCSTLSELAVERIRRAGLKLSNCTKIVRGGGTQFWADKPDVYAENGGLNDLLSGLEAPPELPQDRANLDLGVRVLSLERSAQSELSQLFTALAQLDLPFDWGFERKDQGGFAVYDYGHGAVLVCLEPKLSDSLLAALASFTQEPQYLILRQDAFATEQERRDYLELCAVLLPHTQVQLVAAESHSSREAN